MAPGRPAENEPTRSHSGREPRTDGHAPESRDRPAAEEFGGSRFAPGESPPGPVGFPYLLLLVFLRHVTNRMWLAAAIFVAIYPFLELWNGAAQPWRLLVALPTAGVILLLCMRAGMLAVQACLVCNMALVSVPMVSDLGAWYARGTIVALAFVGLLTAGAAAAAAYGRASFARASSPGGD